jgi:DNA repair exonuclease SbcCD ATPase subunit
MAKFEEQISNIESLLKQILSNQQADQAEDQGESEDTVCPTCGHEMNGEGHGKMVVMVSKKKLKPGQMPEMPSILKDILGAMTNGK